ncbi:MAG: helical backbone metal receptor [Ginsengibacter sp.]
MILTEIDSSKHYQRIISLVPSITELLNDLALEKEVVAITKFCVHPTAWFKKKERIGGTKTVDIEKVRRLRPDLIIANKEENTKEQVEVLAYDFDILLTDVSDLEGACEMINNIGVLTNREKTATLLSEKIKIKFKELPIPSKKIKATYLIWQKPFMAAGGGTFINDMMLRSGMENLFSDTERYPEITLKELRNLGCEVLLLSSEPYPFKEKHIPEISTQLPGTKIMLADGEMFSWYGSRLLKAVDYFGSVISKLQV